MANDFSDQTYRNGYYYGYKKAQEELQQKQNQAQAEQPSDTVPEFRKRLWAIEEQRDRRRKEREREQEERDKQLLADIEEQKKKDLQNAKNRQERALKQRQAKYEAVKQKAINQQKTYDQEIMDLYKEQQLLNSDLQEQFALNDNVNEDMPSPLTGFSKNGIDNGLVINDMHNPAKSILMRHIIGRQGPDMPFNTYCQNDPNSFKLSNFDKTRLHPRYQILPHNKNIRLIYTRLVGDSKEFKKLYPNIDDKTVKDLDDWWHKDDPSLWQCYQRATYSMRREIVNRPLIINHKPYTNPVLVERYLALQKRIGDSPSYDKIKATDKYKDTIENAYNPSNKLYARDESFLRITDLLLAKDKFANNPVFNQFLKTSFEISHFDLKDVKISNEARIAYQKYYMDVDKGADEIRSKVYDNMANFAKAKVNRHALEETKEYAQGEIDHDDTDIDRNSLTQFYHDWDMHFKDPFGKMNHPELEYGYVTFPNTFAKHEEIEKAKKQARKQDRREKRNKFFKNLFQPFTNAPDDDKAKDKGFEL